MLCQAQEHADVVANPISIEICDIRPHPSLLSSPNFATMDSLSAENEQSFKPIENKDIRNSIANHLVSSGNLNLQDLSSPNGALSDDTVVENQVIESNESSNQPSPTRISLRRDDRQKTESVLLHTHLSIEKSGKQSLPATEHGPKEEPDPSKITETDIADFIDNFLGTEDLMQNVPSFNEDMPAKHSILQDVPTQAKETPKKQDFNVVEFPMILKGVNGMQGPESAMVDNKNRDDVPSSRYQPSAVPATQSTIKKSEKRKPRTYTQAVPSQHCHICSRRPTEGSPHQVCGNLLKGRCRKTICTKCFHQFRWDLHAARSAPPGTWECPHCKGNCPQRAQCVIYNRTSDRRRLKLINHRKRKSDCDPTITQKPMTSNKKPKTAKMDSPNSGRTTTASVPTFPSTDSNQNNNDSVGLQSTPRVFVSDSKKKRDVRAKKVSKPEKIRKGGIQKSVRARKPQLEVQKEDAAVLKQVQYLNEEQLKLMNEHQARISFEQARAFSETRPALSSDQAGKGCYTSHFLGTVPQQTVLDTAYEALVAKHPCIVQPGTSPSSLGQSTNVQAQLVHLSSGSVNQNGEEVASEDSPGMNSSACIDELIPTESLDSEGFDVCPLQEAPVDLWMLSVPAKIPSVVDGHDVVIETTGDGILEMLGGEEGTESGTERLGYPGNKAFSEV